MLRISAVIGAFALFAFASTTANATELNGVMTVNLGVAALDSDDAQFSEDDYFTFGADARVSSRSWIVEGFATSISDTDGTDNDQGSVSFGLAAHRIYQRSEQVTLGLFVGAQNTTFQDEDDTAYHAFGGVEASHHANNTTFFGQVGWSHAVGGDREQTWESGPFARAGARYFLDDGKVIEGDVTVGSGEYDSTDDGNHYSWGLRYEHQLHGGPFSIAFGYDGFYTEDSDASSDATDHVFSISFRAAIGNAGSVRDRYTHGADRFNAPDFHRAYAYPDDL